jgi:hypothetical protein
MLRVSLPTTSRHSKPMKFGRMNFSPFAAVAIR